MAISKKQWEALKKRLKPVASCMRKLKIPRYKKLTATEKKKVLECARKLAK